MLDNEEADIQIMKSFKVINYHTSPPEDRQQIPNIEETLEAYRANFSRIFLHYDSKSVHSILK